MQMATSDGEKQNNHGQCYPLAGWECLMAIYCILYIVIYISSAFVFDTVFKVSTTIWTSRLRRIYLSDFPLLHETQLTKG